jgi:hypothetical protein
MFLSRAGRTHGYSSVEVRRDMQPLDPVSVTMSVRNVIGWCQSISKYYRPCALSISLKSAFHKIRRNAKGLYRVLVGFFAEAG